MNDIPLDKALANIEWHIGRVARIDRNDDVEKFGRACLETIRAALQPDTLERIKPDYTPDRIAALDAERGEAIEALDKEISWLDEQKKKNAGTDKQMMRYDFAHFIGETCCRLKAIRATLSAPAWRDVSTAPNDGEEVWVWMLGCEKAFIMKAYGVWWNTPKTKPSPTHWQPLKRPSAPSSEGGT